MMAISPRDVDRLLYVSLKACGAGPNPRRSVWEGKSNAAAFSLKFRVTSSFANHLRWLLIIAHGEEGAMSQMPGVRPFDKCHLADQLRLGPPTLLHFLRG
jgi:hypothetical protein